MKPTIALLSILIGMTASLSAATEFSSPLSGSVYDQPTRSLRRMMGFPGNAYLGSVIVPDLDWAWSSSTGDFALARTSGKIYAVNNLGSGEPSLTDLEIPADYTLKSWSRDGSTAALSNGQAKGLILVRWEKGTARTEVLELPEEGVCSAIAIGRTGARVLVSMLKEQGTSLLLVEDGKVIQSLTGLGRISAVTFSPDESIAYAADSEQHGIFMIRMGGEALVPELVVSTEDQAVVSSLALNSDGKVLFAAMNDGKKLQGWKLETRDLFEVSLESEAKTLEPMQGSGLYLLPSTRKQGDPLFVLNAETSEIFFVPAGTN